MIERSALLADAKRLTAGLVDDLRARTEHDEGSRITTRGTYDQAVSAGRTQKTYEEWREDLLAPVAAGWVLASVFVRFCEDNGLVADPLLSGPGQREFDLARDHRSDFFARQPTAGDREWLEEVYGRYQRLPAVAAIFGGRRRRRAGRGEPSRGYRCAGGAAPRGGGRARTRLRGGAAQLPAGGRPG